MSNKQVLFEVDISTEEMLKKGAQAQKEIERLKNEADFFKKSIKEGNTIIESYANKLALLEKQGKKNSEEYIRLKKNSDAFAATQDKNRQKLELITNSLTKQKKEYRENQKMITDYNKAVETELGIITQTDGSINQLNRALANNRKIYRDLTKEQRENVAIGGELFKLISKQDQEYKDLQSSIGTTAVRVGDYKEQVKQALQENSFFSQSLDMQIQRIPIIGNFLSKVIKVTRNYAAAKYASAKATDANTKSLKLFRLALIGTGIGAILVALGSLVAYLSSTQEGIDKVNKVLTPLKVVFQSLFGLLQDVGGAMVDVFTNPKKAMVELYDFVKNNIINRFKAFAVILDGITSLDFKKVANGVLQVGTGVEDVIGKTQNLAKNTSAYFDEAWKRGQKIAELNVQIEKSENELVFTRAKLLNQIKEQELIAKNTTLSDKERLAATDEAAKLTKQLADEERAILEMKIEQLSLDQKSNDTSRAEYKELQQLRAELIEKDTEAQAIELKFLGAKNAIIKKSRQDQINASKKAIEDALKESKIALDLYIAEQGVKAKTLKEELIIAEEVSKRKKEILKEQLKAGKISKSEYDLAILQSDNELISKRAELADDLATKELELFKETHQAKLDANTFFTEELLNQETERLNAIAEKEREYHKKRLEQGIINQEEYNSAINEVNKENLLKIDEAEKLREEAQKEKELIDLENKRAIEEERFNNQFELQLSRLDQRYQADLKASKKTGADTTLITKKYEKSKAEIQDAYRETKLNADGQAFGQVADFIGRESAIGKAAALAQAAINIQLGITKALASKGFAGIIEGALIAAKGAVSVGKISSAPTKFEKGGSFMIGGKRHSAGGTKFIGEDGTAFEAEKDERMFILNRQASAALGPILSDINQQYGGVALSHASSYLADGGQVLRNSISNINTNTATNIDTSGIKEAVYQGSKEGISEANIIVKPSEVIGMYNDNQAIAQEANI